jgi:hypothetical protein
MADPLKIVRSLETLSTGYTVFESDQVLTEVQLNGLTGYFDDQTRLTRVELLGVGIVGGLRVRIEAGNKVAVSRGVGITTDGDLVALPDDARFDRIKPYDQTAPQYPPFQSDAGMLKLFELVREAAEDDRAKPMATLPGKLSDRVVLMLMESYQKDPDLCTGTDCDNLGKDAINTVRFLLVDRGDAAALLGKLDTESAKSISLKTIRADRPKISGSLSTIGDVGKLYRTACGNILKQFLDNLPQLLAVLPRLDAGLLPGNPGAEWPDKLKEMEKKFPETSTGIQYFYDFLKDVSEAWNAILEALSEDDQVLCPKLSAFPKHLLLGDLANPAELRTGLYPSPLIAHGGKTRERERALIWRLHALIKGFALPETDKGTPVKITPSRSESVPMELRAIPYYYAIRDEAPIHRAWNPKLTARRLEGENYGYRADEYGGGDAARNPFASQIGFADFFRVEGHIGQEIEKALPQLESLIESFNAPIAVRSALLHNDTGKIRHRPRKRLSDLHRMHHLIRKDVQTRIDGANRFSEAFKAEVETESARPDTGLGTDERKAAIDFNDSISKSSQSIRLALDQNDYPAYRANPQWKEKFKSTTSEAGRFIKAFGNNVRMDFSTSVDHLVTNNHAAWIDWLDILIDHKDQQEDKRLLFQNFIKEHPGVEHRGGVSRGGTLVLVYDDAGIVRFDFMLPYHLAAQPQEDTALPALPIQEYIPDFVYKGGYRLIEPIERKFDKTKLDLQKQWKIDINDQKDVQKEYFKFFSDSLGAISGIAGIPKAGMPGMNPGFSDDILGNAMDHIAFNMQQIDDLMVLVANPDLPENARAEAKNKLEAAEKILARDISTSAEYVSNKGIQVATYKDGNKAMDVLTVAANKIKSPAAQNKLKEELSSMQANDRTGAPGKLLQQFGK